MCIQNHTYHPSTISLLLLAARYTFASKERDEESGLSYFGARYYSSDISIWLSVDPMSDKYPSLSPYVYCRNNPIILVDPNGEKDKPFNEKKDRRITPINGTATPIFTRDSRGNKIGMAKGWQTAYNCHSYAWHNSKGDSDPAPGDIPKINGVSISKWDNNPADDIVQQNARQLGKDEDNVPGDIVIYYTDSDGNSRYDTGEFISHSAVVKKVDEDGNTTEVIGKMGEAEISINHPDAPGYYKKDKDGNTTSRAYFRVQDN